MIMVILFTTFVMSGNMHNRIWAVKIHGRPNWDIFVGRTLDSVKPRSDELQAKGVPHEIKSTEVGTPFGWEY